MVRLLTWFSPCTWGSADGFPFIRKLLHSTFIGRKLVDAFWHILSSDVLNLNGYDSHPELKKLKPWTEAMFVGTSFSILNYETNFFELVKSGKVKVHIADISHLSERSVHLDDGTILISDAFCYSTGWKHVPSVKFLPEGIEKDLGVPHLISDNEPVFNPDLIAQVDEEILSQFPRLRDQPTTNKHLISLPSQQGVSTQDPLNPYAPLTPYVLHRFMVPPSINMLQTHDIAFAGMMANFSTALFAHVQAIWICHYFERNPSLRSIPSVLHAKPSYTKGREAEIQEAYEKLRYETLLHARFGKWRYSQSYGAKYPDFVFDVLPYIDLLLRDMNVKVHRKGWLREIFSAYGPEDYKTVLDESMHSWEDVCTK